MKPLDLELDAVNKKPTEVDKILNSEKPFDGNELYKDFVTKTNIEKCNEEGFVMQQLMQGVPKNTIVKKLSEKYPNEKFYIKDLEKFLSRNTQIIKYLEDDNTKLMKRHLDARTGVEESMRDLLLFSQHHLNKANDEGDTKVINDTIRTLKDVLVGYAKLRGWVDEQQVNAVQVNVSSEVAKRKSVLIKKVVEADFKVEDEEKEYVPEN